MSTSQIVDVELRENLVNSRAHFVTMGKERNPGSIQISTFLNVQTYRIAIVFSELVKLRTSHCF